MNLPNKLTIFRIMLVIPFLTLMALFISYKGEKTLYSDFGKSEIFLITAGIVFLVGMSTDYVDGYLARKNNQVTTFGKLFDPLADKFMTTSALIMLTISNITPFWIVIIFVLRDILVDGSRNLAASNNIKIEASIWGKAKTMLQSIAIIMLIFIYPTYDFGVYKIDEWNWDIIWLNLPLIGATGLSVVSGYKYFINIKPYLQK